MERYRHNGGRIQRSLITIVALAGLSLILFGFVSQGAQLGLMVMSVEDTPEAQTASVVVFNPTRSSVSVYESPQGCSSVKDSSMKTVRPFSFERVDATYGNFENGHSISLITLSQGVYKNLLVTSRIPEEDGGKR